MSINPLSVSFEPAISPLLVDGAALTAIAVDTAPAGRKAHWCTFVLFVGATESALSALQVEECDTIGGTYAAVTGSVFATAVSPSGATSALPTATGDGGLFLVDVDCRKTERFLKLTGTDAGTSTGGNYAAFAVLYHHDKSPDTSLERGAFLATGHLVVA